MRRIPTLALLFVLAGASSFGSCEQQQAEQSTRAPRIVEASPDLFAQEDVDETPAKPEQMLEDTPATPLPPQRPPVAAKVAKVPPAWLERALAETRETDVPLPKEPPTPGDFEPTREPSIPPPLPKVPVAKAPVETPRAPLAPDHGLTTATNVALAIGAIGVGMGAAAASTGDGAPGDRVMTVTWTGIGVASFATAGILYLVDTNPRKGINVMAGPGIVGMRGRF